MGGRGGEDEAEVEGAVDDDSDDGIGDPGTRGKGETNTLQQANTFLKSQFDDDSETIHILHHEDFDSWALFHHQSPHGHHVRRK